MTHHSTHYNGCGCAETRLTDLEDRLAALTNSTENWKREALRLADVANARQDQLAALTAERDAWKEAQSRSQEDLCRVLTEAIKQHVTVCGDDCGCGLTAALDAARGA